MTIVDAFAFADGRTVFIGEIDAPDYIADCECDLLRDGVPMVRIKLEGEMMHPNPETGWRSVSTAEKVDHDQLRPGARLMLRGTGR